MELFSVDEIMYGMNQRPTQHNISESIKELRKRGYNAIYDGYLEKWVLVG